MRRIGTKGDSEMLTDPCLSYGIRTLLDPITSMSLSYRDLLTAQGGPRLVPGNRRNCRNGSNA